MRKFLLFTLIILTQCAWSWPSGWQQNPQVSGSVATTNTTLTASQIGSVIVFNNSTGVAANGTQFTFPVAVVGMQYTVVIDTAKWIYLKPASADTISLAGTSAGSRISNSGSSLAGDSITVVCQTPNIWSIQNRVGTWAVSN